MDAMCRHIELYDFASYVGPLMNLKQRCCRAKNCRFLFHIDIID